MPVPRRGRRRKGSALRARAACGATALAPPARQRGHQDGFSAKHAEGGTRKEKLMAELRSVDPRTLKPNPNNPRTTPVPKEMDRQLIASIGAIGLLQPPVVREIDGELVIRAGDRRTKAAIDAGLATIDVYVLDGPSSIDPMAAFAENNVRVGMNPIDTWRAISRLEEQGWNEQAVSDALAVPLRAVRKLKLLGGLHPPMLDFMAKGSMPNEEQLRSIANAPLGDQEQVWKKFKPKKGHEVSWWELARALSKPRIPFIAAKFDDKLAEEYGVVWLDDLFAPAGEDSRYTTNAEGFFAAQEAWMRDNLPSNGTVLPIGEHGQAVLPKGAERVWGKPAKHDKIGHYVNPRSGEIETVTYREAPKKKAADGKGTKGGAEVESAAKARPDVTQKGEAMIGDYRTDALRQALCETPIEDTTLMALLVLALAGRNVSVQSGLDTVEVRRDGVVRPLIEGGVLTADTAAIRAAARSMLAYALSCRANMSNSGAIARIAGSAVGADAFLPTLATEEFLSCLSRQALERSAAEAGVRVEARVKDTRAAVIAHFKDATWRFPAARFGLTQTEVEDEVSSSSRSAWGGQDLSEESDGGETSGEAGGSPPPDGPDADYEAEFPDAAE
jgi:ParB/RepB/Spo0J family partition protein